MIGASITFLVIALIVPTFEQSTPISPCPNVFNYEPSGTEPGRWYGVVNLSTDSTLHSLWLNVVLDSKADILGNWVGDVTTSDNIDFKIENTKMKIHPGPAVTVRFFVQYNPLNKVPHLQAIRLNGREICNANTPLPAVDTLESVRPRPSDTSTRRPETNSQSRPESDYNTQSRPDYNTQSRPESSRPTDYNSQTRPESSRPTDYNTQTRPESSRPTDYNNQNRPESSRPTETRPSNSRPNTQTVKPSIRPEDKPMSKPVYGRPAGDGPVYVPTSDPGSANPFSIISGQVPTQAVTDRRPQYQATTVPYQPPAQDDDDGDSSVDKDEYFSGGQIVVTLKPSNNRQPSNSQGNRQQGQCGKVTRNNPNPLVVNGKSTLEGQWPWQIALYQTQTVDSKYICGGTLVSHRHVITAAHCVTKKGRNKAVDKRTLTIYLGKHNLRTSVEGVEIVLVSEIHVHPQYNASSFSKDLSILTLNRAVEYTDYIRAACLWPENQVDLSYVIGKRGSVVGWGFDDTGVATEELTLVEMPVVDQETCIRSYSEFFARFTSEHTYCAGYRDGATDGTTGIRKSTSVCNGDSGGGMVFYIGNSWYLRGLVSLSVARTNEYRCDPTHYVVFTDLAKFLPWIKDHVNDY